MDWEAPADAWYVWAAVAIVSVAVGGVALALPTGPPPDAARAANTVDEVAAAPSEASAAYDLDADAVKIDGPTVALRNEHGVARASSVYATPVPVFGDDRLETVAFGTPIEAAYEAERGDDDLDATGEFLADVSTAATDATGSWHATADELAVRSIRLDPTRTIAVTGTGSTPENEDLAPIAATALSLEHTADPERTVRVNVSGDPYAGVPEDVRTVETTLSGSTTEIDLLPDDDATQADAIRYPIDVDVYADDELECSGTIDDALESQRVCGPETAPEDVAAESDWITSDPATGAYRVTLVAA